MIIVNFKTYKEASGEQAVSLAHTICDIAGSTEIEIISCPQAVDLKAVIDASDRPVWVQHVDPIEQDRATGWFPPKVAKDLGIQATLLNHSEHKLSIGVLGETLVRCKEVGLKTLVFADSVDEAKVVAKFEPDWIGYEPSELVGSKTESVSSAKPEVIKAVVDEAGSVPVVGGAGVHTQEDVRVAIKLGAVGVAVATDIVLADNPKEELVDLAKGFK